MKINEFEDEIIRNDLDLVRQLALFMGDRKYFDNKSPLVWNCDMIINGDLTINGKLTVNGNIIENTKEPKAKACE